MGIFKAAGQFITGQYKESAQEVWNLMMGWKFFLENEVVVGIPEETNAAEGAFTSAGLLYMHEQGVPSRNIPPRPVLGPALHQEAVQEQIETLMREAAELALVKGDATAAEANFHKAGMVGRDACKKYISDGGNLAPNAPSTIERKRKKGDGSGEPVPLIDTGIMFGSISYAVRRKK